MEDHVGKIDRKHKIEPVREILEDLWNLLEDEDVEVAGEKEERFEFIYYELLGKTTRRVNQALGRYLSPAEIDFISAKLKSFLKDQGF